ncbi:bidirectional sugar transporter SWEET6b-like isoform X2 [Tasmannia lanceolata]|uniref:bidirectional sugar transporter SWEET6b-like isoform X2 n=1 Tax=Tasmannia lanceolata TaxID=3420 RepID=UPI004063B303
MEAVPEIQQLTKDKPTFYKIWKKGSVEQFSPIPYLATLLNCMLWVFYGLPIVHPHSLLVVTINGIGLVLESIYLFMYFLYSTKQQRLRALKFLVAELMFMALIVALVLNLCHTHKQRTLVVGILCVFFGTCMYASPLSVMRMVIETKSSRYMPFYLSLANFLNGVCWTAYALIHFDLFILIPNGLGALLGASQLILYGCYYNSTPKDNDQKPKAELQLPMSASSVAPGGGPTDGHAVNFR